ncbi:unnamed protein product [Clavelina lepadiformis]|uniref:Uncharacterized protein n=1 Tax=Clavelina lepadiformis TaxID=159417 RepID=A0ABP0FQH3_CLALP
MSSEIDYEKEKLRKRCFFFYASVFLVSTLVHGTFSIVTNLHLQEGFGEVSFVEYYATSLPFTALVPFVQEFSTAFFVGFLGVFGYFALFISHCTGGYVVLETTLLAFGDALFGSTVLVLKGIFAKKWARKTNLPVGQTRCYFTGLLFMAHQLGMLTGVSLNLAFIFTDHVTAANIDDFHPIAHASCYVCHPHRNFTNTTVHEFTHLRHTKLFHALILLFTCGFGAVFFFLAINATKFNQVDADVAEQQDGDRSSAESIPLRSIVTRNDLVEDDVAEEVAIPSTHPSTPENQDEPDGQSSSIHEDFQPSIVRRVRFVEPTSPVLSDEHRPRSQKPSCCARFQNPYKAMLQLTASRNHRFVVFLPIYTGMLMAFVMGELPQAFSCFLGLFQVAFGLVLSGVMGSFTSFVVGKAAANFKRQVSCIGVVSLADIVVHLFCIFWFLVEDVPSLVFLLFPVVGASAGIWKVITNDIYAQNFKGEEKIAHVIWNFWVIAGMCLQFSLNINLCMTAKACIRLVMLFVAVVTYFNFVLNHCDRQIGTPSGDGQLVSEVKSTRSEQVKEVETSVL